MNLENIIIVLSRPSEAGNIGAVCRAMKNMGLSRLRLAAPAMETTPQAQLSEAGLAYGGSDAVIRARAVHAADIWDNTKTFKTLAEATADCSIVIGTTRRRGRRRKRITMTPDETAAFLKQRPGNAALVFGNERTGLDDEELELCGMASHIPASDIFPSLNLSHAVMIYAYELFRALGPCINDETTLLPAKGQWVPLNQQDLDKTVNEITENLEAVGFYRQRGKEEQARFFKDIFSRAGITEWEARYFSGLLAKAIRLAGKQ